MDSPEQSQTFFFAPEIEYSIVCMLWHEPDRCGTFYRELDPQIHLTQPKLRFILEAIDLSYRELGTTDFAIVADTVRELGRLDECGGKEGLLEVFNAVFHRATRETNDAIFLHYVEMLRGYAIGRANKTLVFRFNRGDVFLVQNKTRKSVSSPDLIGSARVAGRHYRAIGFHHKSDDSYSIQLIPD
jgi:hypothetical protein